MPATLSRRRFLWGLVHGMQARRGGAGAGPGGDSEGQISLLSSQCDHNVFQKSRLGARATRPRSALPCLRSWICTPTTLPLVYESKRHLNPSKGASVRGIASQRLTAESATPAASACCMTCFMACPACLARTQPLPLLSRVCLLPNPTSIARTGTFSTIDSLQLTVIGDDLKLCIAAGE